MRRDDGKKKVGRDEVEKCVSSMEKFTANWNPATPINLDKNKYALIKGQYKAYVLGGNHHLRAMQECLAADPENPNFQKVEMQVFWGLDNKLATSVSLCVNVVLLSEVWMFAGSLAACVVVCLQIAVLHNEIKKSPTTALMLFKSFARKMEVSTLCLVERVVARTVACVAGSFIIK